MLEVEAVPTAKEAEEAGQTRVLRVCDLVLVVRVHHKGLRNDLGVLVPFVHLFQFLPLLSLLFVLGKQF